MWVYTCRVVDVMAREGADGGFARDVIVKADGAGGLIVILGGGVGGWVGGFCWGGREGFREGKNRLFFGWCVYDLGKSVDVGLCHAWWSDEAQALKVDFSCFNTPAQIVAVTSLLVVHGEGCDADKDKDYAEDNEQEGP